MKLIVAWLDKTFCLIFVFILILKFWVHTRQNVHSETKLMAILLMLREEDCFFLNCTYHLLHTVKLRSLTCLFLKHVSLTNILKMTIKLRSEPWEWALRKSLGNEPNERVLGMSHMIEQWNWAMGIESLRNKPWKWALEISLGVSLRGMYFLL